MKQERVNGKGISPIFPELVTYFKEASVMEDVMIPPQKPDLEDLVDLSVVAEIVDFKLIDTDKAVSYEGQHLSGQKLLVSILFKLQMKYVAGSCEQTVHVSHSNEIMQNAFIIVPEALNGERICDVIRKNKYALSCYVEDVYGMKLDERTIRAFITYLVDIRFY